mmetsp:Transcript_86151/g.229966  ORF Transcript_86151/g.229966 Transcript_86151/m.229966 type:complete len:214 (+) Transcript_86151:2417-3058(+)
MAMGTMLPSRSSSLESAHNLILAVAASKGFVIISSNPPPPGVGRRQLTALDIKARHQASACTWSSTRSGWVGLRQRAVCGSGKVPSAALGAVPVSSTRGSMEAAAPQPWTGAPKAWRGPRAWKAKNGIFTRRTKRPKPRTLLAIPKLCLLLQAPAPVFVTSHVFPSISFDFHFVFPPTRFLLFLPPRHMLISARLVSHRRLSSYPPPSPAACT